MNLVSNTNDTVVRKFQYLAAANKISLDALLDTADFCMLSAAEQMERDVSLQDIAVDLVSVYIQLEEIKIALRKRNSKKPKLVIYNELEETK